MSKPEWYIIPDLSEFTDRVRYIVYNNFGSWDDRSELDTLIDDIKDAEKEELNKILSHQESLVIVKENIKTQRHKITKKTRYLLDDKIFTEIVSKLNDRMVSNIMVGLVQKGLVETAFDEKANDFVFWVKNNEYKEEIEKPETD
jgi:hypothetical protein